MWLTGKSKLRGDGEQIREEIKREEKATGKDERKENHVIREEERMVMEGNKEGETSNRRVNEGETSNRRGKQEGRDR